MLIADDLFTPQISRKVISDLDQHGLATVPAVIGPETLRQSALQADIETLYTTAYAGASRRSLRQPDLAHAPDNIVNQVWASKAIHGLAQQIMEACGGSAQFGTHFVINALDNRATIADYGVAHFDACYLTLLLPLKVAKPANAGEAGKLRVWPNARPFTQNRWIDSAGCRLYHFEPYRNLRPSINLDLEVGSLYAFYGFRSYHQIVPIVEGIQRVTMLMHFGSPRLDRINGVKRRYH